MKKVLLPFIILLSGITMTFGQEVSKDNYYGNWFNNGSWVGGWTDGTPETIGLPETNADITIHGYIEVGSAPAPTPGSGDILSFSANKDSYNFTVNDTLVVYGDVSFANKAMNLVIGPGAVFIVLGNLTMNNKIDIASSGTLVVSGNFGKSGSKGSFTGSGNVYAGSYSGDAESTIDSSGDSSFTIDQLSDDGFGPIEDFVGNNGSSPLPIVLAVFNVSAQEGSVKVSWTTTTEENNDYFTVERSSDGVSYEDVEVIKGAGNSNEVLNYSFVDKYPFYGKSYYRLTQTDYDGKSETFDAKTVYVSNIAEARLFPNPVKQGEKLTVFTGAEADEDVVLNIFNSAGILVFTQTISSANEKIQLDDSLLPGLYVAKIKSGANQIVKRLIIK